MVPRIRPEKATRGLGAGVWTSTVVHVVAIVAIVLGEPIVNWLTGPAALSGAGPITVVARADWDSAPRPDPVIELDPRDLERKLETDSPQAGVIVADRIQAAIKESQQLSTDEQLGRLQELTGQLNQVSSEKSIDVMAGQFQKWLGTKPRASAPAAEPVAGEFEMATAQIHDVRREERAEGGFRYVAILVDAAGRELETEMAEADGESLYRVMGLIKRNPLLERVYRGIVMGVLDKMQTPSKPGG